MYLHACVLRAYCRLAAVQAELDLVRGQVAAQQAKVSDLGMQAEAVRQRRQLLQVRPGEGGRGRAGADARGCVDIGRQSRRIELYASSLCVRVRQRMRMPRACMRTCRAGTRDCCGGVLPLYVWSDLCLCPCLRRCTDCHNAGHHRAARV
jgi:hypothetical protein